MGRLTEVFLTVCFTLLLNGLVEGTTPTSEIFPPLHAPLEVVFPNIIPMLKTGQLPNPPNNSSTWETVRVKRAAMKGSAIPGAPKLSDCIFIKGHVDNGPIYEKQPEKQQVPVLHLEPSIQYLPIEHQVEVAKYPASVPSSYSSSYAQRYRRDLEYAHLTKMSGEGCPCMLEGQSCKAGLICRDHICGGKCAMVQCQTTGKLTANDPLVCEARIEPATTTSKPIAIIPGGAGTGAAGEPESGEGEGATTKKQGAVVVAETTKKPVAVVVGAATTKKAVVVDGAATTKKAVVVVEAGTTKKAVVVVEAGTTKKAGVIVEAATTKKSGAAGRRKRQASAVLFLEPTTPKLPNPDTLIPFAAYSTNAVTFSGTFCALQSCSLQFLGSVEVNYDYTTSPLLNTYPQYVTSIDVEGDVQINSFPGAIPYDKRALVQRYLITCLDKVIDKYCHVTLNPVTVNVGVIFVPLSATADTPTCPNR